MYYPQTYHHIQEIQKYNIQDYRPRYALYSFHAPASSQLLTFIGWNNSKKPSAKYAKSSVCGNNAVMPSRKQTSRRRGCYRLTIPRENVADMEKWRVRNRKADDMYALYDVWVFCCIVSSGKAELGKCLPPGCAWRVDRKMGVFGNLVAWLYGEWEEDCLMREDSCPWTPDFLIPHYPLACLSGLCPSLNHSLERIFDSADQMTH